MVPSHAYIYFMKPECLVIKEKMFCVLSIISLFTAKKEKKNGKNLTSVQFTYFLSRVVYKKKLHFPNWCHFFNEHFWT